MRLTFVTGEVTVVILQSGRGSAGSKSEALSTKGATILVAEDDQGLRKLIKAILAPAGYDLVVASDGDEAVDLGYENRECLVLAVLDAVMPLRRGVDTMKALRAFCPDLPVLLISGYSAEDFLQELDERTRFLRKPFTSSQLLEAVRQSLGVVET
ncbi:MAG: response regulator [Woeseiaceae bacterium]|nr:response regulator [Woeseiaceae bacterium]